MNCIKCNSSNTHVVNTREYAEGPLSKVHHNIDVDLIDTAIENLLQLKESI